ncbi:MAG: hypothetical protein IPI30_21780 [Saprospiraceae bacterium]|nr:hypothetical protein [Candidatus Vicinibacter affinis]
MYAQIIQKLFCIRNRSFKKEDYCDGISNPVTLSGPIICRQDGGESRVNTPDSPRMA